MMEIDITTVSSAPRQAVWALLADATSWPRWSAFDEAEVEGPAGVGQRRWLRRAGATRCDEVIAFEPHRRLAYTLHSGLPVREHHAEVTLMPGAGGGTAIRWRAVCRPAVPGTGWMVRRHLQPAIAEIAEDLARAAQDGLRLSPARSRREQGGRAPAFA